MSESDKQKVLTKWPDAHWHEASCTIWKEPYPHGQTVIGFGMVEERAWADVTSRLPKPASAPATEEVHEGDHVDSVILVNWPITSPTGQQSESMESADESCMACGGRNITWFTPFMESGDALWAGTRDSHCLSSVLRGTCRK